jgi:hypothetical protein
MTVRAELPVRRSGDLPLEVVALQIPAGAEAHAERGEKEKTEERQEHPRAASLESCHRVWSR